ncbi:hypothetical protein N7493_001316 [Penicillium malachiteum]|uniref:Uncharacterized protein n=1 Tax=Penicillium malachiteum TaxID=1324776 RepID=A0AAD6HU81_9EURO|nr:hypothetical protein N7493_001316 [Penicillium malachiteum]
MSSFYILALMSPIVLCPAVPGLFRITRNNIGYSEKAKNPVIPIPTQDNVDPAMLTDGPIMVIATGGNIDPPAFISGDMEIFGIRRAIYTRVDRDGFTIDLDSQSGPGPAGYKFDLQVQCDFNSSITVDLKLKLSAFPNPISMIINDKSMNFHLGQGEIHLKVATSWTDENPYFEGILESTARVFGVEVKLHSFDVRLSPYELSSLEGIASFVLHEFQRRGISALRSSPPMVVLDFLRNAFR